MVSFGYPVSTEFHFPKACLRLARSRSAWMPLFCSLIACDGGDAGRLGGFDAGPRDAATSDAGGTNVVLRPDGGPEYPVADRVVELAYGDPTTVIPYTVSAAPAMLDVQLSVDTTGSFVEEIGAIRETLVDTVVPAISALVPASSFGVSYFQDFPLEPFGGSTDRPFALVQRITNQPSLIRAAVNRLPQRIGNGGDFPESGYEALYQAASGDGLVIGGRTYVPRLSGSAAVGGGTEGGVGFRQDAYRVIVHATDAASHVPADYDAELPGTHGEDDVIAACEANDVHIVAITNGGLARAQMESLAIATGAFVEPIGGICPTGVFGSERAPTLDLCPLVFDVLPDGRGLSDALVGALSRLISEVRYGSVSGAVASDRLRFVEAVHAAAATPPVGVAGPTTVDSTPLDGFPDTFVDVPAGTTLRFDLRLRNLSLPSQSYEQVFRIRLRIVADAALVVDEWIRIVVPAAG